MLRPSMSFVTATPSAAFHAVAASKVQAAVAAAEAGRVGGKGPTFDLTAGKAKLISTFAGAVVRRKAGKGFVFAEKPSVRIRTGEFVLCTHGPASADKPEKLTAAETDASTDAVMFNVLTPGHMFAGGRVAVVSLADEDITSSKVEALAIKVGDLEPYDVKIVQLHKHLCTSDGKPVEFMGWIPAATGPAAVAATVPDVPQAWLAPTGHTSTTTPAASLGYPSRG